MSEQTGLAKIVTKKPITKEFDKFLENETGQTVVTTREVCLKRTDAVNLNGVPFNPTTKFHCNEDGSYQITDKYGNVTTDNLIEGLDYWESIVNIKTSTGAILSSNKISLHW